MTDASSNATNASDGATAASDADDSDMADGGVKDKVDGVNSGKVLIDD